MKVTLTIAKPAAKTQTVKGKTLEEVFNDLEKKPYWGHYGSNHSHSAKHANPSLSQMSRHRPMPTLLPNH